MKCCNAVDELECPNKPARLCKKCKVWTFCSKACEKKTGMWHEKYCNSGDRFSFEPVHNVVSYDRTKANFFDADPEHSKSADRSNVFISVHRTDDAVSMLRDELIVRQLMLHNIRTDFFGVARYSKIVIFVEGAETRN